MRQKSGYIVGAIGIICLALSFINLFPTPVQAQWGQLGSSFPRQRDLWQFTAMTAQTWDPQLYGHRFTVQEDRYHRLPVVTAFVLNGIYLFRLENDGTRTRICAGNHLRDNVPYALVAPSALLQSQGLVLSPGTYFVQDLNSYGMLEPRIDQNTQAILLSGYWSNP